MPNLGVVKLLRKFADSELGLVSVLTRPFSPFSVRTIEKRHSFV
jgi:hypothetical protein